MRDRLDPHYFRLELLRVEALESECRRRIFAQDRLRPVADRYGHANATTTLNANATTTLNANATTTLNRYAHALP